MRLRLLLPLMLIGCAHAGASSSSDSNDPITVPVETIAPRPEDVATIDGVMKAFYEVTNSAPNAPRQWARDRTLYVPWIRFVAIGKGGELRSMTHQQFVEVADPLMAKGFREGEIHREVRQFGNVAQVLSTYQTNDATNTSPERGVNMLQLYFDGKRWWVTSVNWQSEDADHPLPAELTH